ncbi:MAG: efflux RND transporter periplasmic adaptor subunit [Chitinophagaceae bacterium]
MNKNNYISIIFAFIALVACKQNSTNQTADADAAKVTTDVTEQTVTLNAEQLKNAAIQTGKAVWQNLPVVLKANGTVDVPPQSLFSISFPLGGYLKSTGLLPGTSVQKGAVLAVMEDQSYVQLQQDYLTAKAKLEFLSNDLQRQKQLSDADAVSIKNYQQALSEYTTAVITAKALEEKLEIIGINPQKLTVQTISRQVVLRSPITGYVTKVNVNIGKYVNPTDVLFEIVNPDDIHAAITIFEKDIPYIKKGMLAKVALTSKPQTQYDVEVILVTRNIDENRTGLLHCHFENTNHDLLPGMYLTAELTLNNQAYFTVPNDAVVRFEGENYVFTAAANNQFTLQKIKVLHTVNGLSAIDKSNEIDWEKQTVVVKNAYALLGMLKNKAEDE